MPNFSTLDPKFGQAWDICAPYTMTSEARGYALWQAVEHVVRERIKGCMIECGTWKGGSAMLMVLAARHFGWTGNLILFDTFMGMTPPDEHDVDYKGARAEDLMKATEEARESEKIWAWAGIEEVRRNLGRVSFDGVRVIFVQGPVEETLTTSQTGPIALLRLDTDFYASTIAEMEILYPKLQPGGVLIVDDYGHWAGARKAVDTYLAQMASGSRPYLAPIDFTGRLAIKPPTSRLKACDFLPSGFADPALLAAFPKLVAGDTSKVNWPWLRPNSPHIWRTDRRSQRPQIGVLSYEEAAVLYNFAKELRGRRGLEIGCHLAWSTAHLIKAGLDLDVIDPALGDAQHEQYVRDSIDAATGEEGLARAHLHPGFSPGLVDLARARRPEPWSFAFIDGFHDQGAPLRDAKAICGHMAEDAMVFFHDLICPDVHDGVSYLENNGWNIRLLNTSQVMAVAWRGGVVLPDYKPDPCMPEAPGAHLAIRREQGHLI